MLELGSKVKVQNAPVDHSVLSESQVAALRPLLRNHAAGPYEFVRYSTDEEGVVTYELRLVVDDLAGVANRIWLLREPQVTEDKVHPFRPWDIFEMLDICRAAERLINYTAEPPY